MIVEFQRKMGESCESKVCHWKKEIEKVKVAGKLLNEVKEKQVGHHEDDIMRRSSRGFAARCRGFAACLCAPNNTASYAGYHEHSYMFGHLAYLLS